MKSFVKGALINVGGISSKIKYPTLLLTCSLLMLYMQYSKHAWAMGGGGDNIDYVKYFYSELIFVTFFVAIGIVTRKPILFLILFLSYYSLTVFNFSSWFIQARPFSFFDVPRSIQMMLFYPEFIEQIPRILQLKVLFFILIPIILVIGSFLAHLFRWIKPLPFGSMILQRISFICFVFTILLLPIGLYAKVLQYSTFSEVVNEIVYNLQLKNFTQHPDKVFEMLGVKEEERSKMILWDFSKKNILFFIIETAPYDVYPGLKELCLETSNDWLVEHGRVFNKHYSTYPESDRAIFSLLTGRYPYLTKGESWKHKKDIPGLARFLKKANFSTYFLGTAPLEFHDDRSMIEGLGFENIVDIKETSTALKIIDGVRIWDRSQLYKFDGMLRDKALDIITSHASKDSQPFFLTLAPQSSHAPFQIPPGDIEVTSDEEKIRLNAIWQFTLIKSLVKRLKETKQLENTMIIITGDHGIRHEYESKLFVNPSLLHSLTFHVPLLVAFSEMQASIVDDYITSHVDIAKTITSGFSMASASDEYHGIDLFADVLPNRDVFFFGGDYLPASGMANGDGFFMANRYQGWFFKSEKFGFSLATQNNMSKIGQENLSDKIMRVQALLQ